MLHRMSLMCRIGYLDLEATPRGSRQGYELVDLVNHHPWDLSDSSTCGEQVGTTALQVKSRHVRSQLAPS